MLTVTENHLLIEIIRKGKYFLHDKSRDRLRGLADK